MTENDDLTDDQIAALHDLHQASLRLTLDWSDKHPGMSEFKRMHAIDAGSWNTYFARCRPGQALDELICPNEAMRDLIIARYGFALTQAFGQSVTLIIERSEITIPHTSTTESHP